MLWGGCWGLDTGLPVVVNHPSGNGGMCFWFTPGGEGGAKTWGIGREFRHQTF